jgi:hypothetical protein
MRWEEDKEARSDPARGPEVCGFGGNEAKRAELTFKTKATNETK